MDDTYVTLVNTVVRCRAPCLWRGGRCVEGVRVITKSNDQVGPTTKLDLSQLFAPVTERQLDCLRLVAAGFQTKEIARQLGISGDSVNKHIQMVRLLLGAPSRREAARLFIEWERQKDPDTNPVYSLGPHPMGIAEALDLEPSDTVDHQADAHTTQPDLFAEAQSSYTVPSDIPGWFEVVPLRRSGRPVNDLNSSNTLTSIAGLTIAALVAVGSALSLLSSLNGLVRH